MSTTSTPSSFTGHIGRILLLLVLLGGIAVGSSVSLLAQDCAANTWTLNVDVAVPMCAYPLIVETIWGPNTASPETVPFTGVTDPGTYIYNRPLPPETNPFRTAQISPAQGGDPIGDVELQVGENAIVEIGCCCCVAMEVVQDIDGCIVVNITAADCP